MPQRMERPRAKAPTRAACDKCHDIKTRCDREMGSVECKRCFRLGMECSYSAPLRMGRPTRARLQQQQRPERSNKQAGVGGGNKNCDGAGSGPAQAPMPMGIHAHGDGKSLVLDGQEIWPSWTTAADFDDILACLATPQSLDRTPPPVADPSASHRYDAANTVAIPGSARPRLCQQDQFHHGHGHHDADIDPNLEFHMSGSDTTSRLEDIMLQSLKYNSHGSDDPGATDLGHFCTPDRDVDMSMAMFSAEESSADDRELFDNSQAAAKLSTGSADFRQFPAGRHATATRTPSDPQQHAMHRLSLLQLDLYQFMATIPAADGRSGNPAPSKPLRADDIFSATASLIEILDQLFSQRTGNPTCQTRPNGRPDVATVLSVLSCYLRLLDIYSGLLTSDDRFLRLQPTKNSHSKFKGGSSCSESDAQGHSTPVLNVGSFSLLGLHDLNVSVQLHMISQMLKRVQNMVLDCIGDILPELSDANTSASASPNATDGPRRDSTGARGYMDQRGVLERSCERNSPMTSAAETAMGEIRRKEGILWGLLQSVNDDLSF